MVKKMTYTERERLLEVVELLGKVNPDDSVLYALVEEARAAVNAVLDTEECEG